MFVTINWRKNGTRTINLWMVSRTPQRLRYPLMNNITPNKSKKAPSASVAWTIVIILPLVPDKRSTIIFWRNISKLPTCFESSSREIGRNRWEGRAWKTAVGAVHGMLCTRFFLLRNSLVSSRIFDKTQAVHTATDASQWNSQRGARTWHCIITRETCTRMHSILPSSSYISSLCTLSGHFPSKSHPSSSSASSKTSSLQHTHIYTGIIRTHIYLQHV